MAIVDLPRAHNSTGVIIASFNKSPQQQVKQTDNNTVGFAGGVLSRIKLINMLYSSRAYLSWALGDLKNRLDLSLVLRLNRLSERHITR